ncbi:unnamed protein product, partial [Mesocestoides corti]
TTVLAVERKQCEDIILKFRNAAQPYEICKHILGEFYNLHCITIIFGDSRHQYSQRPFKLAKPTLTFVIGTSRNPQVLYEVGKCLSNAVIREWSTVLCPDNQLNSDSMVESMPYHLLCFLLRWVASSGHEVRANTALQVSSRGDFSISRPQVAAFARRSVLGAVTAIVKRAAAAQAESHVAGLSLGGSAHARGPPTLTWPPFSNPGPPNCLVTFFLDELSHLLAPVSASYQALREVECRRLCRNTSAFVRLGNDDQTAEKFANLDMDQESSRLSFGLAILSAFLDEMNDSDQDAASLNLSLESHAFELLQIFQILLRLVESLIRVHDWPTPNLNNDETTYHLVHCFEVITSWNFLPEHIVDFTCLRPTMRRTRNFRPCDRWECVFGVRGISLTLSLLLKQYDFFSELRPLLLLPFQLHSHLRSVPTFSCRILTSVVALTSLTGPLVSGHTNSPLAEHVSICMSGLARSLTPLAADPLSGVTALLVSQTEPRADDLNLYAEGVVPYSRLAEVEAAFPVFPSTGFHSYELPLLAEMGVNLLRRLVDVCTVLEGFAVGMGWPTTGGEDVLSRLFFYLSAMDAFLGLVKNILLKDPCQLRLISSIFFQCLLLEAGVGGTDGDVDVEDQVTAAHEASERLFAYLSDISNVVPRFASSDSAISFTTGPTAVRGKYIWFRYQMMEVLKRACVKVRANFQRHQRELIKAYFSSHLAAPIGFRKDSTNGGSGGATNEEFDLDIDDDDQMAYEDSLFTIGQFSSSAEGNAMASVVELLVGLLEERVVLLANSPAPDNCNVTLLEDVHWLLLFVGHVLVTGPSKLGASKGAQPAWDSDFSVLPVCSLLKPNSECSDTQCRVVDGARDLHVGGIRAVPSVLSEGNRKYAVHGTSVGAIVVAVSTPQHFWPSVLAQPTLFGVLFRLLSLQVSSRIGSAQLTEDSLWVFVRLTLTYFSSNNPNGHLEDCEVESTNEQLSLLRALLRPPTSNHYSAPGFSCAENVTSALILAARLAMSTWLGEPKITAMASCLLAVIARHSLVSASLSKENANPTRSWIELCGLVCGPNATVDTWPSLLPETLTELVDTCARGCWCLRASTCSDVGVHNGNNVVNLFYQFVEELRSRLSCLFASETPGEGDVDPSLSLAPCLAAVAGLARASRWIVTNGSHSLSSAPPVEGDLMDFLWTGTFLPILQNCSTRLLQRYHVYHDFVVTLVALFSEVADNCLLYLANCPATVTQEDAATARHFTNGATVFSASKEKIAAKFTSKTADEERVTELQHLFSLFQFFLGHEFELRLCGTSCDRGGQAADEASASALTTVDVTLVCLGFVMPLVSHSLLAVSSACVPDVASSFYHLLSYGLELRPEGLLHLASDPQKQSVVLSDLGRMLRHGVFNLADTTVNISSLEAFTYLAEFCARGGALASMLVAQLPLGKDLLRELLGLVTQPVFSRQLEDPLASCLFALVQLHPTALEEVATECVARCPNPASQHRLRQAFIDLSKPFSAATSAASNPRNSDRIKRTEFQQQFRAFVPTVRAFLCSF